MARPPSLHRALPQTNAPWGPPARGARLHFPPARCAAPCSARASFLQRDAAAIPPCLVCAAPPGAQPPPAEGPEAAVAAGMPSPRGRAPVPPQPPPARPPACPPTRQPGQAPARRAVACSTSLRARARRTGQAPPYAPAPLRPPPSQPQPLAEWGQPPAARGSSPVPARLAGTVPSRGANLTAAPELHLWEPGAALLENGGPLGSSHTHMAHAGYAPTCSRRCRTPLERPVAACSVSGGKGKPPV
jgi:hypothetical protein